ncbi:hypothetical protein NEILACOT_04969 [Neisseria lactamica ATCC 23970]|uniref:Uncharacterized protein n=1 Tax=Neisseria lactamica ATCC 23970 TaxID=546265 RepID=D0WBP2_NEILA|nr:hypothetical protein NEILACOT_04969 [Neisseria lactamica ATCC 23970]
MGKREARIADFFRVQCLEPPPNAGTAQGLLDAADAFRGIGMVRAGFVPGTGGMRNPYGAGVLARKKAQQGIEFQNQADRRHSFTVGPEGGIWADAGGKPDILFTVLCYYIPRLIFNPIRKNG